MSYQKTNWQDLPSTATPINTTNLNKMENGIADANGAIGVDAYDSTATYAVGDLCIYNNTLYKCKTTISIAESFTSGHWIETTILNELQKNCATAKIDRQTITYGRPWASVDIPITSINPSQQGTGITLQNNKFVIGRGVNKILISATFSLYGNSLVNQEVYMRVKKNGADVYLLSKIFTKSLDQMILSGTLIDVSQGDIIDLSIFSGASDNFEVLDSIMTLQQI